MSVRHHCNPGIVARRVWLLACSFACVLAAVTIPVAAAPIERSAQVTAVPSGRQASRVAVLPITGAIDEVTLWSVERRLHSVNEGRFDAVAFELDTPGGEVGAMLDICLRIKSEAPANTVAWIKPKAYSAGTYIALTCRELVVAPGSVFGDAAPIQAAPGVGLVPLPAAERAKMESPLLDELDAAAARRGDDPRLLQSFVAVERELWLIERISDGARRFADRADLDKLGIDPAKVAIVGVKTTATSPHPMPPSELELVPEDAAAWRILEVVDTPQRLLVAQSDEALRWGLASAEVRDEKGLAAYFGASEIVRFPENWAEDLVRFLISWPVRIVLIAIFIVAVIFEALHPGIGVAGAIAAAALILLIGAPSILGLAQWWEILLVVAGILLIGAEIFVLPGTGVAGVAGALCIVIGLVASFTGTDPTSASQRSALITASTTTFAGVVLGAILTWFASRWFRETSVFKRAVLSADVGGGMNAPVRGEPTLPSIGAHGEADTDLRPSGRARFGNDVFDAQSTGAYLARGTAVRVVSRIGSTVIVEAHDHAGEHA